MNTRELHTAISAADDEPVADPTGQLLLPTKRPLTDSTECARFHLSKNTRERGLRHIAEIRAQLASSKAARADNNVVALPRRREPAA